MCIDIQHLSPKNKDTFLILNFFLLQNFYWVKKKIDLKNYIFINVTQQALNQNFCCTHKKYFEKIKL